jgi:DNA-binding beta-propeller fold protein YncE
MVPNLGQLQQMDRLPDGDYVMGSENAGGVIRVYQSGAAGFVAPVSGVYGVRVGPDGMVYAADMSAVYRIDPTTKVKEVYLPQKSGFSPKVLDFSPDLSKMYIGTISSSGKVYAVDLDANFDPVGNPYLFANNVGGGWHDGLGVDICGNLYVNDYNSMGLYRVSPDGSQVEELAKSNFWQGNYGHGLAWGSGIGGWLEGAIYMPLPYKNNQVVEFNIGVPYRTWAKGSVINRQ